MQTKTISEYNFTKEYTKNSGAVDTLRIKLKINHASKTYSISSTYRDEKFNFQNIVTSNMEKIAEILNLLKQANSFATNELLKIN